MVIILLLQLVLDVRVHILVGFCDSYVNVRDSETGAICRIVDDVLHRVRRAFVTTVRDLKNNDVENIAWKVQ